LAAYDHQDLPFERLVEELQPERDLSHTPLFDVMFGLQNTPGSTLELPGLRAEAMQLETGIAKFDLTLIFSEDRGGLQGTLEYSTELFEPDRIDRMIGHYETLLRGIVARSEGPISDLPLLTSAEERQVLNDWNMTSTEYSGRCVHRLFEACAESA